MKMSVRKINDETWRVNIGQVGILIDTFSLQLGQIMLEEALKTGQDELYDEDEAIFQGYIKTLDKLKSLDDLNMQKLLNEVNPNDIMAIADNIEDEELLAHFKKNIGPLLSKQLERDREQGVRATREEIQQAIRQLMTKAYQMEQAGELEFIQSQTEYI